MQVQSQIQSLIHTTFSCIAYLRDLLDDSCFEDQKLGKSLIKKLVKNSKSKEILNLLEGMYESIELGYLESFEIGIYVCKGGNEVSKGKGRVEDYGREVGDRKEDHDQREDTNDQRDNTTPTSSFLSESYSFEINYNQNDSNPESTIKSFCLYLQKLKPLPPSKYVTLKLYYNEKVPLNYNPKGFKDGTSHNFIYKNKKIKIKEEGKGNGVIPKEIYVDEGEEGGREVGRVDERNEGRKEDDKEGKEDKENIQSIKSQPIHSQPSQPIHSQPIHSQPSQPILSQPSQRILTQPTHTPTPTQPIHSPTPTQPTHTSTPTQHTHSPTPTPTQPTPNNNNDLINCLCGDPSDTFDLIHCDFCNYWLHTVCCGFYSNTDKRIPKGKYKCYKCNNNYDNCKDLIYFRKSLSILYNEGFKSYSFFNKRMNIPKEDCKNLILKLEIEGFLKKYDKKVCVMKNDKIKKKIKEYFKMKRSSIPKKDVKMGY